MKRIITFFLFLATIFLIFIFQSKFHQDISIKEPEFFSVREKLKKRKIESQIFSPPPLKKEEDSKEGFLTKEGIIKWTNKERERYNINLLKENELLAQSAKLKLEDMFENQYFTHVSPKGIRVRDLVLKVGYEFISIGENLAMGNFKSDKELVKAWMGSEGHRENILSEKFQEIGVAVRKGNFEGKEIWIAVCHFGKPLSACPLPNEKLKEEIEKNENKLKEKEEKLLSLKKEIEGIKTREIVKEKVKEYNRLVEEYNLLLRETKDLILKYNQQVELFNSCLSQ